MNSPKQLRRAALQRLYLFIEKEKEEWYIPESDHQKLREILEQAHTALYAPRRNDGSEIRPKKYAGK